MSAYYTLLTKIGLAKLTNAQSSGSVVQWSQMAVGDGNGATVTPTETQTALVHETYRASINRLAVDDTNPNYLIAELVIPATTGGFTIREIGIFDTDGNLVAVANSPENYKPVLSEGSATDLVVRVIVMASNVESVQLKIDPYAVMATRQYVDDALTQAINKLDRKQSVRAATTANISLSGIIVIDGVQLASGDRVLVKDQLNTAENGIYIASAGVWSRSSDANSNLKVTSGMETIVELGDINADSTWQLITDGNLVLGTSPLSFVCISGTPLMTCVPITGDTTARGTSTAYRFMSPGTLTVPVVGSQLRVMIDHSVDLSTGNCIVSERAGKTIATPNGSDQSVRLMAKGREFLFVKIDGVWRVS